MNWYKIKMIQQFVHRSYGTGEVTFFKVGDIIEGDLEFKKQIVDEEKRGKLVEVKAE